VVCSTNTLVVDKYAKPLGEGIRRTAAAFESRLTTIKYAPSSPNDAFSDAAPEGNLVDIIRR